MLLFLNVDVFFRDTAYGRNWQVTVGEHFGAVVRTQIGHVIFFAIGNIYFYVFKSDLVGGGIFKQTEPMT
jgi:hypothetical protein